MDKQNPLVSIVVITYNSGEYILETLNSAYSQTYANIELIVTDDCSTDNTVELAQEWINVHSSRFVSAKLVKTPKNSGISANCNRGFNEAKGEWVKIIAGDDLLEPSSIQCYMEALPSLPSNLALIHGLVQKFTSKNGANTFTDVWPLDTKTNCFYSNKLSNKEILAIMVDGNRIAAPSILYNRTAVERVGGFDDRYRFMEDYPLHIALISNGYNVAFIDKTVACYRVSDSSISHRNSQRIYSTLYLDSYYRFIFEKIYPLSSFANKLKHKVKYLTYKAVVKVGGNKHNFFTYCVLKLSTLITRTIDRVKRVQGIA